MIRKNVVRLLESAGFFETTGAYVLVDGQYGSTGKGLAADLLEQYDDVAGYPVEVVTTNAGPNSGHTAVLEDGTKIFTQQLPVFSACRGVRRMNVTTADGDLAVNQPMTYLNGGAVLDMSYVEKEAEEYAVYPYIHAAAAVINQSTQDAFHEGWLDKIASTGKGVGQAMAAKVLRMPYTYAGYSRKYRHIVARNVQDLRNKVTFVETAQGFSLGINSGFYPYTTSRECSVPQALADAGISPYDLQGVFMTIRAHPIRVGNTEKGESGPCYPDQKEISWEELGVEAELTSVTKRVRRVFTFSEMQLEQACLVNRPNVILLNFCNYLTVNDAKELAHKVFGIASHYNGNLRILIGMGPKASDVYTIQDLMMNHIDEDLFKKD